MRHEAGFAGSFDAKTVFRLSSGCRRGLRENGIDQQLHFDAAILLAALDRGVGRNFLVFADAD